MNIQHLTNEQRTIAEQRVRIEELEEEIRLIKAEMEPIVITFPIDWRLTAQQQRLLMALYRTVGTVRRDYLLRMMESKSEFPDRLLKVVMVKLRQKVRPFGIEIHNHFKIGYWIDAEGKAIVQAALEGNASA